MTVCHKKQNKQKERSMYVLIVKRNRTLDHPPFTKFTTFFRKLKKKKNRQKVSDRKTVI